MRSPVPGCIITVSEGADGVVREGATNIGRGFHMGEFRDPEELRDYLMRWLSGEDTRGGRGNGPGNTPADPERPDGPDRVEKLLEVLGGSKKKEGF